MRALQLFHLLVDDLRLNAQFFVLFFLGIELRLQFEDLLLHACDLQLEFGDFVVVLLLRLPVHILEAFKLLSHLFDEYFLDALLLDFVHLI